MPIRSDAYSVRFHCPEYDTCRQECPDLLLGNMSMKNISDFNNQETIAKLFVAVFVAVFVAGWRHALRSEWPFIIIIIIIYYC